MTHNQSKKALYEVIAKAKFNSGSDKPIQQPAVPLRDPVPEAPKTVITETPPPPTEKPVKWLNKPRLIQLNAGRVEISISAQAGFAILLGTVLVILVVFRAGQLYTNNKQKTPNPVSEPVAKVVQKAAPKAVASNPAPAASAPAAPIVTPAAETKKEEPAVPAAQKGDNIIVIAQSLKNRDLEPVQKFFADNGIETKIEQRGERFVLVTKNAYENPQRSGTDGHAIKAKIIKLGPGYKAPPGYESFPKAFSDAYGEKVVK